MFYSRSSAITAEISGAVTQFTAFAKAALDFKSDPKGNEQAFKTAASELYDAIKDIGKTSSEREAINNDWSTTTSTLGKTNAVFLMFVKAIACLATNQTIAQTATSGTTQNHRF